MDRIEGKAGELGHTLGEWQLKRDGHELVATNSCTTCMKPVLVRVGSEREFEAGKVTWRRCC